MKIHVFKRTEDLWYGSYELAESSAADNMLVEVSFTQTGPNPDEGRGEWRVCVWGNDDCGMERDFTDKTAALNMFYQVIGWTYVNKDQLENTGFVFA